MVRLPRQLLVEARVESRALPDPAVEVVARLETALGEDARIGRRVAIAVGSRGIDRLPLVVDAIVAYVKERGGAPFVVPAMGSHGGGTPEGQAGILAALGVTEEAVGVPVRSSVETLEIGQSFDGARILTSREALEADAVILVNRIKPHTDFAGRIGSGLLKMSAIGLGKVEGAFECHRAAAKHGHENVILTIAPIVLSKLRAVYGVALVEDGHHRLSHVEVLSASEIPEREPELCAMALRWMARLPFPEIDLLIVDEIGKNVSGAGMDTNVTGRGVDGRPREDRTSDARTIYVRGLTPETQGNGIGLGFADVVSTKVVRGLDLKAMYLNALSAMVPAAVRIPMHFPTDAECVSAALRMAGVENPAHARIVRVRNTLALHRFVASEAYLPEIGTRDDLRPVGAPQEWRLTDAGEFDPRADLLVR